MAKSKTSFEARMARLWFGLSARADFYSDLAAFLDAGQSPGEILQQMLLVANKRKRLKHLAFILKDVSRGLAGGSESIGVALSPWIPAVEASMIVAGQATGKLVDSVRELAWNVGEQARIKEAAMKKGLPLLVLIVAAFGLMVYVLTMVVPQAEKMVTPAVASKLLVAPTYIAVGKWVMDWILLLLAIALGIVIAAFMSLTRWSGKYRIKADRLSLPWSMYAWTQASFFLSTVSSMLVAGQTFRDALTEIQRSASPWQKWHLRRMLAGLQKGGSEVKAMDTGMLPEPVMDRLLMYSTLPNFVDVMARLAKDSIRMYEKRVEGVANTLQIGVMILLAVFILVTFGSLGEVSLAIEEAAKSARQGSGM